VTLRARRLGPAFAVVGVLLAGCLVLAPRGLSAGERHAGTVLAVDPQSRTLTVDEYVANAERRALRVQVPQDALVVFSQRNPSGLDVKSSFRDRTISLADIRVGDFVVVELSADPDVARLVMVTLRRGAGS
jgi:hypothetical protein